MLKPLVFTLLVALGLRYGWLYINSEDFQKYGDQKKAGWTCHVNNTLASFYETMSEYQLAYNLYERTAARCPQTSSGEDATFRMADCLQNSGRPGEAMLQYQKFAEEYKDSKYKKLALEAYDRIRLSR